MNTRYLNEKKSIISHWWSVCCNVRRIYRYLDLISILSATRNVMKLFMQTPLYFGSNYASSLTRSSHAKLTVFNHCWLKICINNVHCLSRFSIHRTTYSNSVHIPWTYCDTYRSHIRVFLTSSTDQLRSFHEKGVTVDQCVTVVVSRNIVRKAIF